MSLVTLEDAIIHLRMSYGVDDVGIASKLAEAEDWAIDIMGANYNPEWTPATVPGRIRTAIMFYLSGIYDADDGGELMDAAYRIIERWRDHVAV